jgi:hypothetical protein
MIARRGRLFLPSFLSSFAPNLVSLQHVYSKAIYIEIQLTQ